ncbi:hypothetical protein ACN38_g12927 [Penicillium nordicum]|uniref:Uncharacterized protein n=1 Tax=Penicillium nordicum TaxID=229535 RepID=A0A0M8NXS9_9EURO|nr:hypothetical protein ACN38_g12927 [Penicillium nordicum]
MNMILGTLSAYIILTATGTSASVGAGAGFAAPLPRRGSEYSISTGLPSPFYESDIIVDRRYDWTEEERKKRRERELSTWVDLSHSGSIGASGTQAPNIYSSSSTFPSYLELLVFIT